MNSFWGLVLATAIAAVAWIYQRAWDRQQVRIERYQAILDYLPGFTRDNLDTDQMNKALVEIRRLWLFAPDDVIKAANEFITAVLLGHSKRPPLTKLVLAMRRDSSFRAALVPTFFRNNLDEKDVGEIIVAKRGTEA
jgi:hypothetical protein